MKLTKAEAEALVELVEHKIRTLNAQQRPTRILEKLHRKLSHYLSLKGHPEK